MLHHYITAVYCMIPVLKYFFSYLIFSLSLYMLVKSSYLRNFGKLSLLLSSINASVTSSTEATKSKTVIKMENDKIYLQLNIFTTPKVWIFYAFSVIGISHMNDSCSSVLQLIIWSFIFGFTRFPLWWSWRLWGWRVFKKLCKWLEEILDMGPYFCHQLRLLTVLKFTLFRSLCHPFLYFFLCQ